MVRDPRAGCLSPWARPAPSLGRCQPFGGFQPGHRGHRHSGDQHPVGGGEGGQVQRGADRREEPAGPVRLPRRVPLHLHRQQRHHLGRRLVGHRILGTDISPVNPGEALLIAEGGIAQRIKAAYLSDTDIRAPAGYAAWTRRTRPLTTPAGPAAAVA